MALEKQPTSQVSPQPRVKVSLEEACKWSPRCLEDIQMAANRSTLQAAIKTTFKQENDDLVGRVINIQNVVASSTAASSQQLAKHPSLTLDPAAATARPYCGLLNTGAAGPRNSAIQLLYNNDTLRNSIEIHRTQGPLHAQLATLFSWMRLNANTAKPVANADLFHEKLSTVKPQLIKCHDAQSYLITLLSAMHQEANKANPTMASPKSSPITASQVCNYTINSADNSYLSQMAFFQRQKTLTCSACQHVNTTWSNGWYLPLNAPLVDTNDIATNVLPTIVSCLKSVTETQVTSQDVCDQCKSISVITNRSTITHAGRLIIIHLLRPHASVRVLVDEHIRLCDRSYVLSTAVIRIEISGSNHRWGALARQSASAWMDLSDRHVFAITRNDAKKILDEQGYLFLYEELSDTTVKPRPAQVASTETQPPETDSLDISSVVYGPLEDFVPASTADTTQSYGFCGLTNLAMSCYANSCLQALYTVTSIRRYLMEHPTSGPFHQTLAELFSEMQTKAALPNTDYLGSVSLPPKQFMAQFRTVKPAFCAQQMADAQEFLSILIELTHQEANVAKKRDANAQMASELKTAAEAWNYHVAHVDDSFFSKTLMGQVESTLTCLNCSNQNKSWSCIWQLQLHIESEKIIAHTDATLNSTPAGVATSKEKKKDLTINSLKECITEYEDEETLSNDCSPYCSQCNGRHPATKRVRICRLASLLIVHLKRFAADGRKLYRQVIIDEHLQLAGTCFVLSSAVLHQGAEYGGHYFTIHREADGRWVRLDDTEVTGLTTGYAANLLKDSAYICLYQAMVPEELERANKDGPNGSQCGAVAKN